MDKCPVHSHPMPFDRQYMVDPYATYARMRQDGPAHRICLLDGTPAWYVTRYQDVLDGLRDNRLLRSPALAGPDYAVQLILERSPQGNLMIEDPPNHTRLRRFINVAFHPRRIVELKPMIRQWVAEIIDSVDPDAEIDIMGLLAVPLPINAICHIMGVPERDRPQFLAWGTTLFMGTEAENEQAFGELFAYLSQLVATKRAAPDEDLMSRWWQMSGDDGAAALTDGEMVGLAFLLLLAGYHTTVAAIGISVLVMLQHPERAAELRADPALFPAAVEELFRRDGSVHSAIRRFAAEDLEIGGVPIAKGDTVVLSLAGADRDPARFPDPDALDFHRANNHGNLAFGRGPHFCPGVDLAKVEIQAVLEHLLTRYPDLALAVPAEEIFWEDSYFMHMMRALPIRLGRRTPDDPREAELVGSGMAG